MPTPLTVHIGLEAAISKPALQVADLLAGGGAANGLRPELPIELLCIP